MRRIGSAQEGQGVNLAGIAASAVAAARDASCRRLRCLTDTRAEVRRA